MNFNPEFRRNLLLEWSTHRIVLVGGVLAGVFTLVGLFDPRGFGNVVANVGVVTFVLTTMVWGSHRAGASLLEELRDRTWDSQRMSALDPWSMTWGKIFGATIIPWFAGTIALTVFFFARQGPTITERLEIVLTCVGGAILGQGLSLIGALVGTRLDKHGKSTLTSWAAVGTLVLLSVYFSIYYKSTNDILWYGTPYHRNHFLTVSILILAAWTTFGAYRLMCAELAVATWPWAWSGFVLYLTIYFAGGYISASAPLPQSITIFAAMGLLVSIGATYISAFALYRDPLTFRRLKTYAVTGRFGRLLEETPNWMASLSIAALFMIGCAVMHFAPHISSERIENVGFSAIVIWLYAIRDLTLLYYFTYSGTRKRVESSTIICLALLYWILPSILESMGLLKASWLFSPPMWEKPILSSVIIAVHVIVIGALCYQRYRQRIAPSQQIS